MEQNSGFKKEVWDVNRIDHMLQDINQHFKQDLQTYRCCSVGTESKPTGVERNSNKYAFKVSRLKVVFVSDRGDSEHCVICCTEIHCTVIQLEGVDNQSSFISSISLQFDLVFKSRLFSTFLIKKVSHQLKAQHILTLFVP